MFNTSRDSDVRRRNKVYNNNSKIARSSKISLLSTLTVSTTTSGGSNSTITQESYDRSHKPKRKRTRENREHREHRSRQRYTENKNKSVHVFDFLVDENAQSKESLPTVPTIENSEDVDEAHDADEEAEEDQAWTPGETDEMNEDHNANDVDETGDAAGRESSDRAITTADVHATDTLEEVNITKGAENVHRVAELTNNDDTEHLAEIDDVSDASSSDSGTCSEDEESLSDPPVMVHVREHEPEGYYRSMSDSGISMGSGRSSLSGCLPRHQLPVLHEEPTSRPVTQSHAQNELAIIDHRWTWSNPSSQPYPETYIPPPCPAPPPAVVYDVPGYRPFPPYPHPPYTPHGTPPPTSEEDIYGPGITIREPSGRSMKPKCFRAFTKVSTRLILQMQDDLADLEEELDSLDKEVDVAEQNSESGSSSSRSDKRDRAIREDDIYREFHAKLDQYYHALEMMQKVEDISQPAVTSDLSSYHKWLNSRILQSDRTRQLVSNDLRKFTLSAKVDKPQPSHTSQSQYLAYSAFVNALTPMVLFKVTSGVLNRLILLAVAVIAGLAVQGRSKRPVSKDELTCTLLCVSISVFAAVCL